MLVEFMAQEHLNAENVKSKEDSLESALHVAVLL